MLKYQAEAAAEKDHPLQGRQAVGIQTPFRQHETFKVLAENYNEDKIQIRVQDPRRKDQARALGSRRL